MQFHICYHSHLNVSQKTKTNLNFRDQTWVRPTVKCWVKGSILPHKYHTEDSGILQLTKNAKTNNNIADYHFVSCRVVSTPSDVQHVYGCPKSIFILPQKYHVSVSNMLSQLLKCVIKKKTNINFRGQTWYLSPHKVLGQGLYFTP